MRLNLGCGNDVRQGYVNVDLRKPADQIVDLNKFPWPWADASAAEILMLDFLEHFPYAKTEMILQEAWRILEPDGRLDIQVPDFAHCSAAAENRPPFLCNCCGWEYSSNNIVKCEKCSQSWFDCAIAAIHRLYGGQDYEGNWHFNSFTKPLLGEILGRNGFDRIEELMKNENGETYWQNWNIKLRVRKNANVWGDDE
jgi:hypothetical protein